MRLNGLNSLVLETKTGISPRATKRFAECLTEKLCQESAVDWDEKTILCQESAVGWDEKTILCQVSAVDWDEKIILCQVSAVDWGEKIILVG
jgi:hypothetical protein